MAYSAVPTVATNDAISAAWWNTYIRDNFAAGVPDIIAAKGDLVAGSAADTAGILSAGTNYTILQANSGATYGVEWSDILGYGCIITRSTAQSIANNSDTAISSFDGEERDSNAFHAGTDGFIAIPAGFGGVYWIGAKGFFDDMLSDGKGCQITVIAAGTSVKSWTNSQNSKAMHCRVSFVKVLAAADQVTMSVYQQSGAAKNFTSAALWAVKIR